MNKRPALKVENHLARIAVMAVLMFGIVYCLAG